jgi:hypothetical protein
VKTWQQRHSTTDFAATLNAACVRMNCDVAVWWCSI